MTTRKEGQNYQLIVVYDREIVTSYYNTLEEAQDAMCNEMQRIYVVEKSIEENPDYLDNGKLKLNIEEDDFETSDWFAWANDTDNDYDFLIEEL